MTPSRRSHIVSIEGYDWDISNLCENDKESKTGRSQQSIYPMPEPFHKRGIQRTQGTNQCNLKSPPIPTNQCVSPSSSESTQRWERCHVEVSPGSFMHLRGADETVDAIAKGNVTYAKCFACEAGLQCVSDCNLVICPDCHTISPVVNNTRYVQATQNMPLLPSLYDEGDEVEDILLNKQGEGRCSSKNTDFVGGVGLGVKI